MSQAVAACVAPTPCPALSLPAPSQHKLTSTLAFHPSEGCPPCRRLEFDDLHRNGIYTWPYLHDLGQHKLSRMRHYIRTLRERGLSREPPRLRARRPAAGGMQQGAGRQQQGQQQAEQQQQQQLPSSDGGGDGLTT